MIEVETVRELLKGITGEWITQEDYGRLTVHLGEYPYPIIADLPNDNPNQGIPDTLPWKTQIKNLGLIAAAPDLAALALAQAAEIARMREMLEGVRVEVRGAVESLDVSSALTRQYVYAAHDALKATP